MRKFLMVSAGLAGLVAAAPAQAQPWHGGYGYHGYGYGPRFGFYGGFRGFYTPYYAPRVYYAPPPVYYPPPVYVAPPVYPVPIYHAPAVRRTVRPKPVQPVSAPCLCVAPAAVTPLPPLRPAPAPVPALPPGAAVPSNNVYPPESFDRPHTGD